MRKAIPFGSHTGSLKHSQPRSRTADDLRTTIVADHDTCGYGIIAGPVWDYPPEVSKRSWLRSQRVSPLGLAPRPDGLAGSPSASPLKWSPGPTFCAGRGKPTGLGDSFPCGAERCPSRTFCSLGELGIEPPRAAASGPSALGSTPLEGISDLPNLYRHRRDRGSCASAAYGVHLLSCGNTCARVQAPS
jgi:hypothetical protein